MRETGKTDAPGGEQSKGLAADSLDSGRQLAREGERETTEYSLQTTAGEATTVADGHYVGQQELDSSFKLIVVDANQPTGVQVLASLLPSNQRLCEAKLVR